MDTAAEEYFYQALHLFYETQWLHNIRVTEILTKKSLDAIPKDWLEHLQILQNDELNDFVATKITKSKWPSSLKVYIEKCQKYNRLPTVSTSLYIQSPPEFRLGLSEKKQHEIIHLAHLVHAQCESHEIRTIIDIGAGLGYVCQLLHYLYGYQVLGLEGNKENVTRAYRRQQKMYPDSSTNVKYVHCELSADSVDKIESILWQHFPNITNACLIGLHACGDLSTDASRIFLKMRSIKLLILISCCYHKLSISKSEQTSLLDKQYFHNFPMSNCLQKVIAANNFDIGQFLRVPFLRLACQESADKWHNMTESKHDEHAFHVLARAVLELYAQQNNLVLEKKVCKATRKSQCSSFDAYIKDSLSRYDLISNADANLSGNVLTRDELERNITQLWREQTKWLKYIEVYTGLQLMLQLPAESLILHDRLCWLHEQGLEAVVVPVTNKHLSPRSYAIVSHKR